MKRFKITLTLLFLTIVCNAEASTRKPNVQQKLTLPPIGDEVCFSPDEACDTKLVQFIQSAKVSIDLAIFDINLDQVVHEVLVQSKKIPVRILVDRRQAKAKHSLVPLLAKAGAKLRKGRQRGIMHHKFMIIDGKALETGSFNYTNGAAFKNNENQIYLTTPKIIQRYQQRFEQMWAEGDTLTQGP